MSSLTNLDLLEAKGNELTAIDLSANRKLSRVSLEGNLLTELNVSNISTLTYLNVAVNKLTQLKTENCPKLFEIMCYSNQLDKNAFKLLSESLLAAPERRMGEIYVIDSRDETDKNVCPIKVVEDLKQKNWNVYDWKGYENQGQNKFSGHDVSATQRLSSHQGILVTPNPVIDYLHISSEAPDATAIVMDLAGNQIETLTMNATGEGVVNLSHLPQGIYLLTLSGETVQIIKRDCCTYYLSDLLHISLIISIFVLCLKVF